MPPDVTQLKLVRYARGKTLIQASEITGLSQAVNNVLENRKSAPRQSTITKLQQFYEAQGVEFGQEGWVRLSLEAEAAKIRATQAEEGANV